MGSGVEICIGAYGHVILGRLFDCYEKRISAMMRRTMTMTTTTTTTTNYDYMLKWLRLLRQIIYEVWFCYDYYERIMIWMDGRTFVY